MQTATKNWLERNAILIAILITILIAYLSIDSNPIHVPIKITNLDKILHFSAYFTLTTSWFFALREKNKKLLIIISLILYGILLEYSQEWFTTTRTKDMYDAIANTTGIVIAAILFKYIYKYYKKIFA